MPQALTADDRLALFDLYARYAWAYDCGDAEAYADTFIANGVLADENGLRAKGRPAIAEAIKTFFAMRDPNVWQHHNDHLHIEGDGEQCTIHSYWAVLERRQRTDGGYGVMGLGWYISRCQKVDGVWLFAERTFLADMPQGLPWKRRPVASAAPA